MIQIDDNIDLAEAEREPYSEPEPPLAPATVQVSVSIPAVVIPIAESGEPQYPWLAPEREQARVAVIATLPPKQRAGGFHPSPLPGEVGPCTRCGWVWYPSQRTLINQPGGVPARCSNCRSPDWSTPPKWGTRDEAYHRKLRHNGSYPRCTVCHPARPGDPKWMSQRGDVMIRRRDRHAKKLAELAEEFGKRMVDEQATTYGNIDREPTSQARKDMWLGVSSTPPTPPPRAGHVIPPPPSFEEGE